MKFDPADFLARYRALSPRLPCGEPVPLAAASAAVDSSPPSTSLSGRSEVADRLVSRLEAAMQLGRSEVDDRLVSRLEAAMQRAVAAAPGDERRFSLQRVGRALSRLAALPASAVEASTRANSPELGALAEQCLQQMAASFAAPGPSTKQRLPDDAAVPAERHLQDATGAMRLDGAAEDPPNFFTLGEPWFLHHGLGSLSLGDLFAAAQVSRPLRLALTTTPAAANPLVARAVAELHLDADARQWLYEQQGAALFDAVWRGIMGQRALRVGCPVDDPLPMASCMQSKVLAVSGDGKRTVASDARRRALRFVNVETGAAGPTYAVPAEIELEPNPRLSWRGDYAVNNGKRTATGEDVLHVIDAHALAGHTFSRPGSGPMILGPAEHEALLFVGHEGGQTRILDLCAGAWHAGPVFSRAGDVILRPAPHLSLLVDEIDETISLFDYAAARRTGHVDFERVISYAADLPPLAFLPAIFRQVEAVSPDGRWVYIGDALLDSHLGRTVTLVTPRDLDPAADLARFSPDSRVLLRLEGTSLSFNRLGDGALMHVERLPASGRPVSMRFSPLGDAVIIVSRQGKQLRVPFFV